MSKHPVSAVLMDEDVPYDVVKAVSMPDDVVQGALMALRTSSKALRVVRLSAMHPLQLQAALEILRCLPSLKELSFVDAASGVTVPRVVSRRLHTLSIVSPRTRTMKSLFQARCAPKKLQLLRLEMVDGQKNELNVLWPRLTRQCRSADVTLVEIGEKTYDPPGDWAEQWDPPFTNEQCEQMRIRRRFGPGDFEVSRTVCMRAPAEENLEEGRFGAATTLVSDWIAEYILRIDDDGPNHREADGGALVELHCQDSDEAESDEEESDEEGSDDRWIPESKRWDCEYWSESSSAHDMLYRNNGTVAKDFVDEVVGSNGIDTLLLTTTAAPYCSATTSLTGALAVSRIAVAARKVRVLAISAAAFSVLKEVRLPKDVIEQVGVVDMYVTRAFVKALPGALRTLASCKAVRSVWVAAGIPLRGNHEGREKELRRAERACRRAEAVGLCATGVRGAIERWLIETTC
ncbi:hypothetical protein FGB62_31g127 [Gracilaria domingensis]|nr:hypothetical protein FGB62_31g127 [Gracilaria domingensis]